MGSLRSSDIQTPVAITVRQVMDVAKTSQPVSSFLSLFFSNVGKKLDLYNEISFPFTLQCVLGIRVTLFMLSVLFKK